MPFTLAHPAAIVPFARRGFVISALVVGSIAPDLSYFVALNTNVSFGHSIAALFWFCLPMGLVILWLFHSLLKRPLMALLPEGFQRRLASSNQPFAFSPLPRLWGIMLSLWIGSITHLVWDSFTHPDGWIVERLPVFTTVVFRLAGSDFQIYKLLQYASSVLGMAVIIWWVWRLYQKARPVSGSDAVIIPMVGKCIILISMLGIATGLAIWLSWLHSPEIDSLYSLREFAAQIFVSGTSVFCVELILFGVIWKCWVEKEAKYA
jgi:hypothetical protein